MPPDQACEPEAHGFVVEGLRRLDRHLRGWVDAGRVAGIGALIFRDDAPVYQQSLGYRDRETAAPLTPDTLFRIHSLSKPVTAAAILALLEEGRLCLSDPLARHLPAFAEPRVHAEPAPVAAQRPITLHHLLTHTAGFGYGGMGDAAGTLHPVDQAYREARLLGEGTLDDVVRKLAAIPLKCQPGERFEYSVAYDLLGAVVEAVTGQAFDDFLRRRFFAPLGMADTGFAVADHQRPRFAALYGPGDGEALSRIETPRVGYPDPPRLPAGGQGLVSTLPDFSRFVRMLAAGGTLDGVRCLSRKSIALMTANHLSPALRTGLWMPGYGYGLGVGVLLDPAASGNLGSPGEYTWAGSASTYFWVDPDEALVALLFAQYEPSGALSLPREFKALMYQALR